MGVPSGEPRGRRSHVDPDLHPRRLDEDNSGAGTTARTARVAAAVVEGGDAGSPGNLNSEPGPDREGEAPLPFAPLNDAGGTQDVDIEGGSGRGDDSYGALTVGHAAGTGASRGSLASESGSGGGGSGGGGRVSGSEARAHLSLVHVGEREAEREAAPPLSLAHVQGSGSAVPSVTAVFFDEARGEVFLGDSRGRVWVWR